VPTANRWSRRVHDGSIAGSNEVVRPRADPNVAEQQL
jgi:hypothetical protein